MSQRCIANSLCIGLYHNSDLIGFGRAITDYATFAYLADIVIDEEYRKRGLGKWLTATLVNHEQLQDIQVLLRTQDAHTLYERFGFERKEMMVRDR